MALVVKESGGKQREYTPVPAGTHAARCVGLFDLGRQETSWKGQAKVQNKIILQFELVNEMLTLNTEDGPKEVPHVISREFTATLSPMGTLRPLLESWRGRPFTAEELSGFSMGNVVGKACLITVQHETKEDRTYSNLVNITAPMKGMNIQEASIAPKVFDMDEIDYDVLGNLPKWIQEKVRKSIDFPKTSPAPVAAEAPKAPVVEEDDLPF